MNHTEKLLQTRYFNPYTDFGFKKLFGEEANKNLLIDFLNQLLPIHHQICSLEFKPLENLPDTEEERKAIFDIHCQAESGERFIVEMQKAKLRHFKDRCLYYMNFPIMAQAKKGDWNFELEPIYMIAVLDFEYDTHLPEAKRLFMRQVHLKDQNNHYFSEKLQFIFLQMPFFNKSEQELNNHFDKWCYFLKNLQNFNDIPHILKEDIFEQAFHTAEVSNMSKEDNRRYKQSLVNYWGVKSAIETAREEAEERYQALLDQAEKEKKQAEKEKKQVLEREVQSILNLHKEGFSVEKITLLLNLREEEVKSIIEKNS